MRASVVNARLDEQRLFCFGFGFTSLALSKRLLSAGWAVSGACTSSEKAESLKRSGVDAHAWDPDNGVGLDVAGRSALLSATCVLSSVPPKGDADADQVLSLHRDDLIACASASGERRPLRWAGYLCSTGVYGDADGAEVDEESPLLVTPASGKAWPRAQAEAAWLALHDCGVPVHSFRLGGIYGPGRSILDSLRGAPPSALQAARRDKRHIARVHVADIVAALVASMCVPRSGRVYNVVDDDPSPRAVVAAFAAALLAGGDADGAAEEAGREQVGRGARDDKRVSNDRMKRELGVALRYPTYREGLRAIAGGDKAPFG